MAYAAPPLNQLCRRIRYTVDTVTWVATVASKGCCQGSLDDSSAFHLIQQRPTPWPLFGLAYRGGGGTGTCSVSCRMGFAKARMCTALSVKRRWHSFGRKEYQRWRTCTTHG